MRSRFLSLATTIALLAPPALAAQRVDSLGGLARGRYVRVAPGWKGQRWHRGTLLALDTTSLTIRRGSGWSEPVVRIPLDSVQRIEVQVRESARWKGAAIGMLAGLAGTGVVAWHHRCRESHGCPEGNLDQALGVLLLGPPLVLAGTIAGARLAPGAEWREVPVPR